MSAYTDNERGSRQASSGDFGIPKAGVEEETVTRD